MVGTKLLFRQLIRQVGIRLPLICTLNNFAFLRLTPRCAPTAIAAASILAMFFVYVTHSDVISFRSAIKVKVSLGLAKVKPYA